MQQRPHHHRSPAAAPGPSLQNSNQGVARFQPNFTAPLPPPLPSFPCNGITPPHPHPVAPFPPPPHSHGTLHPGPIAPPPPSSPHRSQPFYTLAMTHLPTINPRPRPHSSLFPHSPPPPQFPLPPPPPPPTTVLETRPAVSPIQPRPQLLQPVPLRFPYPTTINITCTHCGNHLIVDLTAHNLTNYRVAPSRPRFIHTAQNGPVFWRLPLVRSLTPLTPPTQTSVSASSSAALPNPHGAHLTSLCRPPPPPPPPPPRETPREKEKEPRSRKSSTNSLKSSSGSSSKSKRSGGGKGASSHPTAGIIPYRERRRATSIETQARQQLELEFATLEKPTVMKMGEIAGRLRVSREFVRQWFANHHHRLQQRVSSLGETKVRTIPSDTYEITVEVPPTDNYLLPENGVQTVVVQKDTSPK